MLTRRPRILSNRPRLEAVRPLPRLDATPPVTKMCVVSTGRAECAGVANSAPVVRAGDADPPAHGVSEYQEGGALTCTDAAGCEVAPLVLPPAGKFGARLGRAVSPPAGRRRRFTGRRCLVGTVRAGVVAAVFALSVRPALGPEIVRQVRR